MLGKRISGIHWLDLSGSGWSDGLRQSPTPVCPAQRRTGHVVSGCGSWMLLFANEALPSKALR